MSDSPSLNGNNGRDSGGRFIRGNSGGPGNPYARRVNELRSALMDAVGREEVIEVVKGLLKKAKTGDVQAAKLLFERLLGPPEALDVLQRLDELDEQVAHLLRYKAGK